MAVGRRALPDDLQDVLRRLRRDLDGRLGERLGRAAHHREVRRTPRPRRPPAVDPAAPRAERRLAPGALAADVIQPAATIVERFSSVAMIPLRLRAGKPESRRKILFFAGRASHCSVTFVPPSTGSKR